MGVPDSYRLPESYNDAYHLMGDGLVVPVVGFISEHLLRRLRDGDDAMPSRPSRLTSHEIVLCDRSSQFEQQVETFASELGRDAHTVGSHGLSQAAFDESGIFRAAIERLRGQVRDNVGQVRIHPRDPRPLEDARQDCGILPTPPAGRTVTTSK